MSEEQKRLLEKQLWGVANVLCGKMKNYISDFDREVKKILESKKKK